LLTLSSLLASTYEVIRRAIDEERCVVLDGGVATELPQRRSQVDFVVLPCLPAAIDRGNAAILPPRGPAARSQNRRKASWLGHFVARIECGDLRVFASPMRDSGHQAADNKKDPQTQVF